MLAIFFRLIHHLVFGHGVGVGVGVKGGGVKPLRDNQTLTDKQTREPLNCLWQFSIECRIFYLNNFSSTTYGTLINQAPTPHTTPPPPSRAPPPHSLPSTSSPSCEF